MSKSDLAIEAAQAVRGLLEIRSEPALELIPRVAFEYEIEPHVVQAWLLREFESIDALDAWGAAKRQATLDAQTRAVELTEAREDKFKALASIIDSMSDEAIAKAWLPQFTPWWRWIHTNHWMPERERHDALDFAHARLLRRPKHMKEIEVT